MLLLEGGSMDRKNLTSLLGGVVFGVVILVIIKLMNG
jgi:hypothetical protein